MNKNIIIAIIGFCFFFLPAGAKEHGTLPEIMKPEMIRVSGNELFVVQGAQVFNYSLKNLKLLRTIGRKGEGPGELPVSSFWHNTVTVYPDSLFIDGFNKVLYFNRAGKLIKEVKKKGNIFQTYRLGKHFLVLDQVHTEGNTQYQVLNLYGVNFRKIKELCRQPSGIQPRRKMTDLVPDSLHFQVYRDRLYVERSPQGFLIEVYDETGKKLYDIRQKTEPLPLTAEDKARALQRFKDDAPVKEMGFENFKRNVSDIRYPKHFPAIRSIDVSKDKIYVRTFKRKKGKEECVVMDLTGKTPARTYLTRLENAAFLPYFLGIRYYTIHDGTFYYLKENEEEETWELFSEAIL